MIDSACNRRSGAAAGEIRKRGDAVITERMMGGSGKGLMFRGISAGANEAGHSRASQSADRPRGRLSPRPLRRVLAAGAALCAAGLALVLAGATPAQAQSNATTRIWSADMTVGESGPSAGFFVGSGGTLSDTTFTFKGVERTISNLSEADETITFWISPGFGTSTNQADVTAYIEDLYWSMTQGTTSYGYNFDDRLLVAANGNTVFIFADTTRSWSSGEDIEVRLTTRAPSAPRNVRATASTESVQLSWETPSTNGGGSAALRGILRYEFRYKVGSGSYGDWQNVPGGASARSHTLTDLEAGVGHTFQLRARNGYGSVVYSGEVSATPKARAAITDIDIETEPTAIGSFPGFHGTGDFIQVRVTFSRDVLGTPESGVASLKLLVGGKERTARAQFTQLPLRSFVFVYTIQADDVDLDGITVPADALVLPQGGALQNTDGVDAVLTHAAFEFPEDIVNPPLPEITNIEVSSPVPDAGFHSSVLVDPVEFRVTFSEAVTMSGARASFTVRVGDDDVGAAYSEGSGTTQLRFVLVYGDEHTDPDGVSVPAGSLTLSGGTTLRDAYGRDVMVTHGAYAFPQHLINTLPPAPEITNIEIVSPVPDAGFHSSVLVDPVEFRVTFSEAVTMSGARASFTVRVGDDDVGAAYSEGSGTTQLRFVLVYGDEHTDPDGVSVPAGSLTLSGGTTLRDAYGRDVMVTHGAYAFPGHLVNTPPAPPHFTSIEVASSPGSGGFYATGDTIELHVTFSGPVTTAGSAPGTPPDVALKLRVGSAERSAEYLLGSGTSRLRFLYTVQAGDEDRDGVSVPANALSLGTGMTLKDRFGQDVESTHGARGFPDHLVNSAPPPRGITGIDVVSPVPDAGFYATGDTIELHVTFSGAVTAAGNAPGTPPGVALALRVGSADKSARYLLGSGTSKLRFLYTVQAGDEDRDGVSVPANGLSLGTGMTLKGPYGQDADLTHGAYGPFRHARVNFEAAPPSAPRNLAVTADNENEVTFRWEPPADDGGAPVTHYAYRYDANEDGFTRWAYVGSTPGGTAAAQELGHRRRGRRGQGVRAGDGGERGQLPDRAGAAQSRGQRVAVAVRDALRPGRGGAAGAGAALGDLDAGGSRGPRMGRAGRERQLAAVGLPHRGLDRRRR